MYSAKVIADSIAQGVRLTTLEVVMPRFILAEFNTHRMFSRNSASSRAIPVEKHIRDIEANPFVPMAFGRNQKGMQAGEALDEEANEAARILWREACEEAVYLAQKLAALGVHKQHANRLLEPFAYHTAVVTATEWDNFFALRISPMAQPEIRATAEAMKAAMDASAPFSLLPGDWHLPYVQEDEIENLGSPDDRPVLDWVKIACARCARVSYLTHDGKRDPQADLDLYERLASAGHMSPLEHAAQVRVVREVKQFKVGAGDHTPWPADFCGNFRLPWVQHRKQIPNENVFRGNA